eukprot:m.422693 g.422693  ORF g.422693 m.422693 type:complete len:396 (-) comp38443_c0_seq1:173-1360(-)
MAILFSVLMTLSIGAGCRNDTDCYGSVAWECSAVTSGGSPCRINGQQSPRPPYTPWPVRSCACVAKRCGPPPAPPRGPSYGCRSGRCIEVLANGTSNSSETCEWVTGCVPLEAEEWLAASFEFKVNGTTATCIHDRAFLKKSELSSVDLPPALKLAVPQGTVIQLLSTPRAAEDGYWVIACAVGTMCAATFRNKEAAAPLPSYLMIGDSISLGYLAGVESGLAAKFAVTHSAGNAGNANNIAHSLDCYLRQLPEAPDVVTFNAGIHDLALGQEWLSLTVYKTLIASITARLVATKARVIFVTTTPVPTNGTDATVPSCPEGIIDTDVVAYNTAASAIALAAGAEVLDLHAVVTSACGGEGYTTCAVQEVDNPHFVDAGWQLLAEAVSKKIAQARV